MHPEARDQETLDRSICMMLTDLADPGEVSNAGGCAGPRLAARGESLAASDERSIPASGVAPPSNTPGILSRRALPAGRLARLGATPDFHHGLLSLSKDALRLTARGESLAAFDRRCIPAGCVAPSSNTPGILGRRALPPVRLAGLGATPDFHHGLLRVGSKRCARDRAQRRPDVAGNGAFSQRTGDIGERCLPRG